VLDKTQNLFFNPLSANDLHDVVVVVVTVAPDTGKILKISSILLK